MKLSEKLINLLKKELPEIGLDDSYKFKRLYPGSINQDNGAWSWELISDQNIVVIGSQWTVSDILKSEKILYSYTAGEVSLFLN